MHVSWFWTARAEGRVRPSPARGDDHRRPDTFEAVSKTTAYGGLLPRLHSCHSASSRKIGRPASLSPTRKLRRAQVHGHGEWWEAFELSGFKLPEEAPRTRTVHGHSPSIPVWLFCSEKAMNPCSRGANVFFLASVLQVVLCFHAVLWTSLGVNATHSGVASTYSGHLPSHQAKRMWHGIVSFPRGFSEDLLSMGEEKVPTPYTPAGIHATAPKQSIYKGDEETEESVGDVSKEGLYSSPGVQFPEFQHDWRGARSSLAVDNLSATVSPARDFYGYEPLHAQPVGHNGYGPAFLSSATNPAPSENAPEPGTSHGEPEKRTSRRKGRFPHVWSQPRRLLTQEAGSGSGGPFKDGAPENRDGKSETAATPSQHNVSEQQGESTGALSMGLGSASGGPESEQHDESAPASEEDEATPERVRSGRQRPDEEGTDEIELQSEAAQKQRLPQSRLAVEDDQGKAGLLESSRRQIAFATKDERKTGSRGANLSGAPPVERGVWWMPHTVARGQDRSGEMKLHTRSTAQLFHSSRNGFEALFAAPVKRRLCLKVLMHNTTARMFAVLLLLHLEWPTFTSYRQGTGVFLMNLKRKATSFDEHRDFKYAFLDHCPVHRILAKGLDYLADEVSKYADLLALKKDMQSKSREFRHSVRHLPVIKKQASSRPGLFQALLVAWDLFSTSILKFKLFGAVDPEAQGKSVLYFMDLSERLLDLWFKERSFDVTMLWAYLIHGRVLDGKTHRRPQQSTSILLMDGMRDYLFGELPHHKLGAGILYTSRQLDALRLLEDRVKDAVHRKLQNALRRYQGFPLASQASLLLRREAQHAGADTPEAVFPALFKDKLLPSVQVTGYFLRGERGEEVKAGIFGDGISDELLEELKAGLPAHSALLQLTMVDAWAWHTRGRDVRDHPEPEGHSFSREASRKRRLSATVGSTHQGEALASRNLYAEAVDGNGRTDFPERTFSENRKSGPADFFGQHSPPSCLRDGAVFRRGLCADPVALDSYLPVTTATQLLNVELRWDPSLLNPIGRTVVLLSDVVDLDNADLHGPEGDPAFDLDVHALLLLPVRDFAGAEGLAQDVVRMVSSAPASWRLAGGQTASEQGARLLNPRRVKVLGTARWVGGSAPKLLLGEFGVGICTKGLQDALALLQKGFVLVHLSIAGLARGFQKALNPTADSAEAGTGESASARRGLEAKAAAGQMPAAGGRMWGLSAKEAFRRFLRRTKGGAARIVYMQTSAEDGIKAAAEKSQRREGRVPFTGMVISSACVVAFFVLVILYLQWTKRADVPWWITCLWTRSAPWLLADENVDASSVSSSEKDESCNCSDAGDAQVSTAATDEFPSRRKRSSSLTSCRLGAPIVRKASCYPGSVCPPAIEGEEHAASQSYFLSPLAPLPVLKKPKRRTLRTAVAAQRCVKFRKHCSLAAPQGHLQSAPSTVPRRSLPPQFCDPTQGSPTAVGVPVDPYRGPPPHAANRLLTRLEWARKERESSDANAAAALQSSRRGRSVGGLQNCPKGGRREAAGSAPCPRQSQSPPTPEGKTGLKAGRRRGRAFGCRTHTKEEACVPTVLQDTQPGGGGQVMGGRGTTSCPWSGREGDAAGTGPAANEEAAGRIRLSDYRGSRGGGEQGVRLGNAQDLAKGEAQGVGPSGEECDVELVVRFIGSDGRRASWV